MKITANKTTLQKQLAIITGIVERKNTIPILSYLSIEASGSGVTLRGTDLDISHTTRFTAEVQAEGSTCLPAKRLSEIVNSLPDGEISITVDDGNKATIKAGRAKFVLGGLQIENFPEIKTAPDVTYPINAAMFSEMIKRTAFAITKEESRYALNGAQFEFEPSGTLKLVATDGHRMAFNQAQSAPFEGAKLTALIPAKAITVLGKLMAGLESLHVSLHDGHFFALVGNQVFSTRLLTGTFPNYELVLPKDNNNIATADTTPVLAMCKRVWLAADDRSHSINLAFAQGQLTGNAATEQGEAEDIVNIEYSAEPITTGVNVEYLVDAINGCGADKVAIKLKNAQLQIEITPAVTGDILTRQIVMPMRA